MGKKKNKKASGYISGEPEIKTQPNKKQSNKSDVKFILWIPVLISIIGISLFDSGRKLAHDRVYMMESDSLYSLQNNVDDFIDDCGVQHIRDVEFSTYHEEWLGEEKLKYVVIITYDVF